MNPGYAWGVTVIAAPLACTLITTLTHHLARSIRTRRTR